MFDQCRLNFLLLVPHQVVSQVVQVRDQVPRRRDHYLLQVAPVPVVVVRQGQVQVLPVPVFQVIRRQVHGRPLRAQAA